MKQVAKPKIFRSGSYLARQQTDDFPATVSRIVQGQILILPSMSLMSTKGFSISQATRRREVEMLGTVVLAPLSNLPLSNSTYPYQTYLILSLPTPLYQTYLYQTCCLYQASLWTGLLLALTPGHGGSRSSLVGQAQRFMPRLVCSCRFVLGRFGLRPPL